MCFLSTHEFHNEYEWTSNSNNVVGGGGFFSAQEAYEAGKSNIPDYEQIMRVRRVSHRGIRDYATSVLAGGKILGELRRTSTLQADEVPVMGFVDSIGVTETNLLENLVASAFDAWLSSLEPKISHKSKWYIKQEYVLVATRFVGDLDATSHWEIVSSGDSEEKGS